MDNRTTASRLSKIEYTRKLYRHVLKRDGKVSKTKRSKLNDKALELYAFGNDPQIGKLASSIANKLADRVHTAMLGGA